MPTAAKLFAAIGYALTAYFTSGAMVPLFPEGTELGVFAYVNAAIGALSGWLVMGRLAGEGYGAAITSGIRTTAVMVFYALLAHSIWEMLTRAVRKRYADTMEALTATMSLIGEFGMMMLTAPNVIGTLIVGGLLAALVSEWASHRWR